jgi:hypothetical protein
MWRRYGAAVAALGLLCGFSAAPYTHAHHAVGDGHHPDGRRALVHSHASPHSHHDDASEPGPAGRHERDEGVWSVDAFVFQQPAPNHAPSPVLLALGEPPVELTCVWLGAHRPQPNAHAPPAAPPPPLRGPPAFPPAFA